MKEDPKDQKAFYKEFKKREKERKDKGGYGMEDFAFDMFVEHRKVEKLLAFLAMSVIKEEEL